MEREILDILSAFDDGKLTIIQAHQKICASKHQDKDLKNILISFFKYIRNKGDDCMWMNIKQIVEGFIYEKKL